MPSLFNLSLKPNKPCVLLSMLFTCFVLSKTYAQEEVCYQELYDLLPQIDSCPLGVLTIENACPKWSLLADVVATEKLHLIKSLRDPLFAIESIDQTLLNIPKSQEHAFLKLISEGIGHQLKTFNAEKEAKIQSKEEWFLHTKRVAFMFKIFHNIYEASLSAAANVSHDLVRNVTGHSFLASKEFENAQKSAFPSQLHEARRVALIVSNKVGFRSVTSNPILVIHLEEEIFSSTKKHLEEDLVGVDLAGENVERCFGALAYFVAQKHALTYILKNFPKIAHYMYSSIDFWEDTMGFDFDASIFASPSLWSEFKEGLPSEQLHFLSPWFKELDRLVEKTSTL